MKSQLQLILGGARSGKSRYALSQGAEGPFDLRIFLATASAGDEEMRGRIERHQAERGPSWQTIEEPYRLVEALAQAAVHEKGLVVVDCTTLWISNLLCGMGGKNLVPGEIEKEFQRLIQLLPKLNGKIILVSNEVGLGLVPEHLLGRQFRDLQGEFNQSVASIAGQVILMVAGIPQKIR